MKNEAGIACNMHMGTCDMNKKYDQETQRKNLEDLGMDGMMLQWILKKWV